MMHRKVHVDLILRFHVSYDTNERLPRDEEGTSFSRFFSSLMMLMMMKYGAFPPSRGDRC